ncbi:hypothetical protein PFDG_04983 [Plasmodium falciparum Dd2]|uniref:Uncharacterized protein n=1 Tax=Plasmodium falciparum (isolate Dd2) TaxID=57267 RepID=A0A0L7M9F9_PLAF4|nr:hypothetical protein PFDG_04983 [Plasmodium falciparum Dd2]
MNNDMKALKRKLKVLTENKRQVKRKIIKTELKKVKKMTQIKKVKKMEKL